MVIKKIISGAQTGADRAALDFAIKNNIPHAGWIPKGRKAEDGIVSQKYDVQETTSKDYRKRTELNAQDSDGTLIVTHGKLTGGSALTKKLAEKHNRPCLHVDLSRELGIAASEDVLKWIRHHKLDVLNVAGSRASKDSEIYNATIQLLDDIFRGI